MQILSQRPPCTEAKPTTARRCPRGRRYGHRAVCAPIAWTALPEPTQTGWARRAGSVWPPVSPRHIKITDLLGCSLAPPKHDDAPRSRARSHRRASREPLSARPLGSSHTSLNYPSCPPVRGAHSDGVRAVLVHSRGAMGGLEASGAQRRAPKRHVALLLFFSRPASLQSRWSSSLQMSCESKGRKYLRQQGGHSHPRLYPRAWRRS